MEHELQTRASGEWGNFVGLVIEIDQWRRDEASGMNRQDFYSNQLGQDFYSLFPKSNFMDPTNGMALLKKLALFLTTKK